MIFHCKKCSKPIHGMVKIGPAGDGMFHSDCRDVEIIDQLVKHVLTRYGNAATKYMDGRVDIFDMFVNKVMKLSENIIFDSIRIDSDRSFVVKELLEKRLTKNKNSNE